MGKNSPPLDLKKSKMMSSGHHTHTHTHTHTRPQVLDTASPRDSLASAGAPAYRPQDSRVPYAPFGGWGVGLPFSRLCLTLGYSRRSACAYICNKVREYFLYKIIR